MEVTNLQARRVSHRWIERAAREVLSREGAAPTRVSVVLLDDAGIAGPHERFLGKAGPTDVLSFRYPPLAGAPEIEVLLSVETAGREARRRGIPLRAEVARYVVHGLLHALGYRDDRPAARRRMFRVQERILGRLKRDSKGREGRR